MISPKWGAVLLEEDMAVVQRGHIYIYIYILYHGVT